jgi:hypothetical protein
MDYTTTSNAEGFHSGNDSFGDLDYDILRV